MPPADFEQQMRPIRARHPRKAVGAIRHNADQTMFRLFLCRLKTRVTSQWRRGHRQDLDQSEAQDVRNALDSGVSFEESPTGDVAVEGPPSPSRPPKRKAVGRDPAQCGTRDPERARSSYPNLGLGAGGRRQQLQPNISVQDVRRCDREARRKGRDRLPRFGQLRSSDHY